MSVPGKSFADFVHAMAISESSDDYTCVNKWGFLGRYQFGMPRLSDLGLCERDGKGFRFVPPITKEGFLRDAALQDETFRRHVVDLRKAVVAQHLRTFGKAVDGTTITLSGCVAVCHLLGLGGLADYLNGNDKSDALGTTASTYMKRFAGFDLLTGAGE